MSNRLQGKVEKYKLLIVNTQNLLQKYLGEDGLGIKLMKYSTLLIKSLLKVKSRLNFGTYLIKYYCPHELSFSFSVVNRILRKLEAFDFLIKLIPNEKLKNFIRETVKGKLEEVKALLEKGGFSLLKYLKDLVAQLIAKFLS